jgi:hypothetical protein
MTQFVSRAIMSDDHEFVYDGPGYQYTVLRDYQSGEVTVKLQIPRELFQAFMTTIGPVFQHVISQISICEQGRGWYHVFSTNPLTQSLVLKFIARMNRFFLRRAAKVQDQSLVREAKLVVQAGRVVATPVQPSRLIAHRVVGAPIVRPYRPEREAAELNARIALLQASINSRYGHLKQAKTGKEIA